jgi:hypothetical protein
MELGPGPRGGHRAVTSRCKLTPAVAALFLPRRDSGFDSCQPPDDGQVLRRGHAAYIVVESVEKATDNRSASLLCCRVADADSPETIGLALPRALSPTPLHAPGAAATSTEVPGPRAEGRDRTFVTRPRSPDKGTTKGTGSRADLLPRRTARGRDYAWPMGHSVGRKVALSGILLESVAIRALGLKFIGPQSSVPIFSSRTP